MSVTPVTQGKNRDINPTLLLNAERGERESVSKPIPQWFKWMIVAFFSLFMASFGVNLAVFGACAPDTIQTYGIDQAGLTLLGSVTSCVSLFAGLLFGPAIDRIGSRRVVLIALVLATVSFFVRAFVASFALVIVMTFIASFFAGACQVAAPKVLATWFTREKVSVVTSVQAAFGGVGSMAVFALGGLVGVRPLLIALGVIYIVLFLFWLVVGGEGPVAVVARQQPKGALKQVYTSKYLWFLGVAYGFSVAAALILNAYLIMAFTAKGLAPAQASLLGTCVAFCQFAGGILGSVLMGVLKRYNVCAWLFFGGSAIFALLGWFLPFGVQTWVCVLLCALSMGNLMGVCLGRVALLPLTGTVAPESVGTASGAMEILKGVFTLAGPVAVSAVFGSNYSAVFIAFAVVCLVGGVCAGSLVPELGPNGKLQREAASKS